MALNCFMPLNPLDRIIHQQILLSVMSNAIKQLFGQSITNVVA